MKTHHLLISALLAFHFIGGGIQNNSVAAQTTELQGTVTLDVNAQVFKNVIVPNCPQPYTPPAGTAGTTITYETKLVNDKTNITVEDVVNPGGGAILINANKVIKIPLTGNSDGVANLYLDDKDKSVLYVNYWLNRRTTVPAGTSIEEWYPDYSCAGVPTMTNRPAKSRTLVRDEEFYYQVVSPGSASTLTTWFRNSEQIRVLTGAPGSAVAYYLVNRFDRNAKYILELQNREYIAYNSQSLDLGALTIPFKYRFGYTRNGVEIKDDISSSFNIGFYGGYKLTRYSIINKGGTYVNRTHAALRIGPFMSISATTLDSLSTTGGEAPKLKDYKQTIAVLSTGIGLMGDVKGVQLGIYGGWDFGVGPDATAWNYHKRFWLGFGVGYKITDLFAKKD